MSRFTDITAYLLSVSLIRVKGQCDERSATRESSSVYWNTNIDAENLVGEETTSIKCKAFLLIRSFVQRKESRTTTAQRARGTPADSYGWLRV